MEISRLNALLNLQSPAQATGDSTPASASQGPSFGDMLKQALDSMEQDQVTAEQAGYQLATGQTQDVTAVMVATQKANLSLSLAIAVRNKALDAYQEIMRMPL